MEKNASITIKSKLQNFYGMQAIFIPSDKFSTLERVYIEGKINLHPFQAIAEPWRDLQHVLMMPTHLLNQLWIDADSQVELVFTFSLTIPPLELPHRLKVIFKDNPDYANAFNGMSESDQRQYLCWINSARSPGELDIRVEKTIRHVRDMLHLGEVFRLAVGNKYTY